MICKGLFYPLKEDTNKMYPAAQPKEIIKDPYLLEFLELKENAKIYESDWSKSR